MAKRDPTQSRTLANDHRRLANVSSLSVTAFCRSRAHQQVGIPPLAEHHRTARSRLRCHAATPTEPKTATVLRAGPRDARSCRRGDPSSGLQLRVPLSADAQQLARLVLALGATHADHRHHRHHLCGRRTSGRTQRDRRTRGVVRTVARPRPRFRRHLRLQEPTRRQAQDPRAGWATASLCTSADWRRGRSPSPPPRAKELAITPTQLAMILGGIELAPTRTRTAVPKIRVILGNSGDRIRSRRASVMTWRCHSNTKSSPSASSPRQLLADERTRLRDDNTPPHKPSPGTPHSGRRTSRHHRATTRPHRQTREDDLRPQERTDRRSDLFDDIADELTLATPLPPGRSNRKSKHRHPSGRATAARTIPANCRVGGKCSTSAMPRRSVPVAPGPRPHRRDDPRSVDYTPSSIFVREIVQQTYACRACEQAGPRSAVHGDGIPARTGAEVGGRRGTARSGDRVEVRRSPAALPPGVDLRAAGLAGVAHPLVRSGRRAARRCWIRSTGP